MLYSEFVRGTGCKDNEHNFKVYQDLEVMYMNSDLTKAQIYEYGKKLVDNSKSEQELKIEKEVKEQIEELKEKISYYQTEVSVYMNALDFEEDPVGKKEWRRRIRYNKDQIMEIKIRINALKWVIA